MMLLHGFAQTCHSWDFVALSLCDRYRVIALDQRGHGDSDWAEDGDYTLETQQGDIGAIVDALGSSSLCSWGLSMGGRNSLTYAARQSRQGQGPDYRRRRARRTCGSARKTSGGSSSKTTSSTRSSSSSSACASTTRAGTRSR